MLSNVNIRHLDLDSFNTQNVRDMSNMFEKNNQLEILNISNFDTTEVTNMNEMFSYDINLQSLDLVNFDISKVISMSKMFQDCRKLIHYIIKIFFYPNLFNLF